MTLKEIARIVGVAPSTVSRVINKNDEKCAGKAVRDRIWDIVKETGYTPNKSAQNLKLSKASGEASEQKGSLACIFARTEDIHNDQFFDSIYRIAEQEAFKRDYLVQYTFSFSQLNNASTIELLEHIAVDGVIVLGRPGKGLVQFLTRQFKNIVHVGLNAQDVQIDQIICDGYKAACAAVSYLHQLGHTQIGYIGELNNELRYKGYCDKMKELGLPVIREFVTDVPLTIDGGYRGARELMSRSRRPTSAFCCNDITAVGAIKAIKEKNCKIPEEISIISIDDIEMASYVMPMLTTVSVPREEMGKMAVKILLDRIENGHRLPLKIDLPFKIVSRESCRALK